MPGIEVRPIEYDVVPCDLLGDFGLEPAEVKARFGHSTEVAVERAVDHGGRKLTVMGDPVSWRRLLASGEARRRDGVMLPRAQWPVAVSGWLRGTEPRQARAGGYG